MIIDDLVHVASDQGLLEQDQACLEAHRVLTSSFNNAGVDHKAIYLKKVHSNPMSTAHHRVVIDLRRAQNVLEAVA